MCCDISLGRTLHAIPLCSCPIWRSFTKTNKFFLGYDLCLGYSNLKEGQ